MRPADETRVCQYALREKLGAICGRDLTGRGRWKWCETHSRVVREQQQKMRNTEWQRKWRSRHRRSDRQRRWIDRNARVLHRWLLQLFPGQARSRSLHLAVLGDLRRAFEYFPFVGRESQRGGILVLLNLIPWVNLKLACLSSDRRSPMIPEPVIR